MESVFWPTALGAGLGVVAGVLIQFICHLILVRFQERRIRASLVKEFDFNLEVLTEVKDALSKHRNAVNGGTYLRIHPYIPTDKALSVQINNLVQSGRLYDFMDGSNLKRFQNVSSFLAAWNGRWFADEFAKLQADATENPAGFDVGRILSLLDWADGRARDVERDLTTLSGYFR